MDTLTFGSPILLRHLTFSEARKMPISEIHLQTALEGLSMTMEQVNMKWVILLRFHLLTLIVVHRPLHFTRM
jgi:XPG I-region